MAATHSTWTVLDHGPLERIDENLIRVEGAVPNMGLRRVMTVVKLAGGELVIHSGIALRDAELEELLAFGKPRYLIVPNGMHRLDAPAYVARFPELAVYCPIGSRKRVEEVVAVHGSYADFGARVRAGDDDRDGAGVAFEYLDGTREAEGVMKVEGAGGLTLVFNDAVFNVPEHFPGLMGLVLRLMGSTKGPRVTRLGKLMLVRDKHAFRAHLERLAEAPGLRRIIVSHHAMVSENAADVLRAVARAV
jgi:hypothetical protein